MFTHGDLQVTRVFADGDEITGLVEHGFDPWPEVAVLRSQEEPRDGSE